MRPNVYVTEHPISQKICSAVCEGLGAEPLPATGGLRDGPALVYGLLRGCGEIVKHCQTVWRDFYHIDNGIFRPGHYDGYYRLSKNGFQPEIEGDYPSDRWEKLDAGMRPWRRTGRYILIVPPSPFMCEWFNLNQRLWTHQVAAEAKRHTDRPIALKVGPKGNMQQAIEDAWCVVTFNSMAAVHALREGVPCITLDETHVAGPVSWDWPDIEKPWWPEREPWAFGVAYNQFTLEEFREGLPWRR